MGLRLMPLTSFAGPRQDMSSTCNTHPMGLTVLAIGTRGQSRSTRSGPRQDMTASTQALGHHRTCRQCQRLPLSLPASPSPCVITCPQYLKKEMMELQGLVLMLKGLKKFLGCPSMDLLCLEA